MHAAEQTAAVNEIEELLVIFTLAGESYGVDIEAVNTIIRFPEITHVPHAPEFVEGVINLRGTIAPVIDLRKRLGLPAPPPTKATRVVVVELETQLVGMVVDAVTETLRLPASHIEPLSSLVLSVNSEYLRGVGKYDDRLIILLSLDQVLERVEIDALAGALTRPNEAVAA